jgi:hypothetical protein
MSVRDIVRELGIDETFTTRKNGNRNAKHNKIKDNVPLVENYNMMADVLFLPTASFGFKYLFVIVDLATDKFDIEPMKNKDPVTTLKAMKKCFSREYVDEPEFTLKTDGGNEFKGVFHKYLYDESILHKVAPPHRHTSMSTVESLNRQLGRLFNGYMNKREIATGKPYKNWTDVVSKVRKRLNEVREKEVPDDINSFKYPVPEFNEEVKVKVKGKKKGDDSVEVQYRRIKPKFRVGQMVHRYLDHPTNALGKKQPTAQKREGDFLWNKESQEIVKIITMGGQGPLYRYILDGMPNVSFTDGQLMKAR